jgi:hypothetical protein
MPDSQLTTSGVDVEKVDAVLRFRGLSLELS